MQDPVPKIPTSHFRGSQTKASNQGPEGTSGKSRWCRSQCSSPHHMAQPSKFGIWPPCLRWHMMLTSSTCGDLRADPSVPTSSHRFETPSTPRPRPPRPATALPLCGQDTLRRCVRSALGLFRVASVYQPPGGHRTTGRRNTVLRFERLGGGVWWDVVGCRGPLAREANVWRVRPNQLANAPEHGANRPSRDLPSAKIQHLNGS